MKYFFNILLTFVTALVGAVLVFLVGNQAGSLIGAAITGGIVTGLVTGVSYNLGCMVHEDEGKFNATRFAVMLITGLIGGLIGGLMMGWH